MGHCLLENFGETWKKTKLRVLGNGGDSCDPPCQALSGFDILLAITGRSYA